MLSEERGGGEQGKERRGSYGNAKEMSKRKREELREIRGEEREEIFRNNKKDLEITGERRGKRR